MGVAPANASLDLVFANQQFGVNRLCVNDGSANFTCEEVSIDTNVSRDVAVGNVDRHILYHVEEIGRCLERPASVLEVAPIRGEPLGCDRRHRFRAKSWPGA